MIKINFKKILLVFGGLVLALLVIASFVLDSEEQVGRTPAPPTPNIPKTFKGQVEISFQLNNEDLELPSSAPTFSVKTPPPINEEGAVQIAEGFGFGQNYYTTEDVRRGTTYFWRQDQMALTIYSQTNELEYTSSIATPTQGEGLPDDEIINIAKDFLTQNSLFEENEVSFSFITYIDINSEEITTTTKENATAYKTSFSPVKLDHKIVTLNPQNSPITVWVANDGSVFKGEIKYLGNIERSDQNYRLKNLEDIKSSANQANIISINDGNIFPGDLSTNDLKSVVVKNIELAYLANNDNPQLIQPIYILSGQATLPRNNQVNIALYLPALKN